MTKQKKIVFAVIAVVGLIWAARVIEAVAARVRVPNEHRKFAWDARPEDVLVEEVQVMCANERVVAALFPFIGGPLYRAATGGKREKKAKEAIREMEMRQWKEGKR